MSFVQGSGTPAQLRRNGHQVFDTPTPSSGNNSTFISSIKPSHLNPKANLSFELPSGSQNVPLSRGNNLGRGVGGSKIRLSQQQQHYRAPLSGKNGNEQLNTNDLNLENLEIQTDNTERARRTLEEELQEGFRNLAPDDSNGSDRDSLGYGDLSDLENGGGGMEGMRNFRKEMEDESLDSSSSSDGLGDEFSLHIGMTGNGNGRNRGQEARGSVPIRRYSDDDERDTPVSPRRPNIPLQQQQQQRQASNVPLPTSRESSAAKESYRRPSDPNNNFTSHQPKPSSYRSNPFDNDYRGPPNTEASDAKLPDQTGITFGLASPVATRKRTKPVERSDPDAPGVLEALNQLKNKLSGIQLESSAAHSKVRNYEESIRQTKRTADIRVEKERNANRMRTQSREEEEEEENLALQAQINRLKSQVANLTHTADAHFATIESLQSQLHSHSRSDAAVRGEVYGIQTVLESLGDEVAAVKGNVDELVREKSAGREWEREERERKAGMEREREARPRSRMEEVREEVTSEDPDRTPRAGARTYRFAAPASPMNGTSFIPRREFEGYQTDLDEQERQARASPTPKPRRTKVSHIDPNVRCTRQHLDSPRRSSTAPLPSTHRSQPSVPPLRTQNSYESYVNQNHPQRHSREPLHRHSTEEGSSEDVDQDQRLRAERIFESVKKASGGEESGMCSICRQRKREGGERREGGGSAPAKMQGQWRGNVGEEHRKENKSKSNTRSNDIAEKELMNLLRAKEADFESQKRLYLELSKSYQAMDAKANGEKRRMLADHLIASIDKLEVKADTVRALHDLLHRQASPSSHSYTHSGRMGEGII